MGSMWPLSIFGCFAPVIGLLLLAECCRVLWLTLVKPSRPREAECGKCGYTVAGLTEPQCPECGADLRIVGVNTAMLALRHRGSTLGAILAWTALTACVGVVAMTVVGIFSYRFTAAVAASGNQVWTTPLFPKSGAYSQILHTSSTNWGGGGPTSTKVSLELTRNDSSTCTLNYDSASGKYNIVDPAGSTSPDVALTTGAATALFQAAALDTTDAGIAAEAAELDTILKVVAISPYTMPAQMTLQAFSPGAPRFTGPAGAPPGGTSWARETLPVFAVAGLAFMIWAVGLFLIIRRRHRLLADSVHSPGM